MQIESRSRIKRLEIDFESNIMRVDIAEKPKRNISVTLPCPCEEEPVIMKAYSHGMHNHIAVAWKGAG